MVLQIMFRAGLLGLLLVLPWSSRAGEKPDGDRQVGKLVLEHEPGKKIELSLTRARTADGGLVVKVVAKGLGPKPVPLVIYQGGGDDDGVGDEDVRGVVLKPFELGNGIKGARIDLTFRVPDGKKKDVQTDTTLIGFAGKPHKLLQLTTERARDRSKVCRDLESTELKVEGTDLGTATTKQVEPALGDDDLPIDKSCKAPSGAVKKVYRWEKDHFVDPNASDDDDGDD